MGTIRTFIQLSAKFDEIEQIAEGVALGTGNEISVEFDVGGFYPVTFNEPIANAMILLFMMYLLGNYNPHSCNGAEDFSYFSQKFRRALFLAWSK